MTRKDKRRQASRLQQTIRALRPASRPASCLMRQAFYQPKNKPGPRVEIVSGGRARYAALHRCGCAWSCPHCAPILSEERRAELAQGLKTWRDVQHAEACVSPHRAGLPCGCAARRGVALVTLTHSHDARERLADLVEQQGEALRWMTSCRAYKDIRADYGVAHVVRSAEVTYGENGWHPHHHFVWLTEAPLTDEQARDIGDRLHRVWARACQKFGLGEPSREHGVDVGIGSRPDEYVTKWGAAEELTLGRVKVGRAGSLSPWGLLQRAQQGDAEAGKRWCEFLAAYVGRAQLYWSPGMRAALGVTAEVSDEEMLERNAAREQVTHVVPLRLHEIPALVRLGLRETLLEVLEGMVTELKAEPKLVERAGRMFCEAAHAEYVAWQDAYYATCLDRVNADKESGELPDVDISTMRRYGRGAEVAFQADRKKLRANVLARVERGVSA